ncbi:site-specific DNA-methyltransferase (adenine-specific) [Bradyrhizobium sp. USDA 4341]
MTVVSVLTGDFRDILASLGEETVDCIIADPPYGSTKLAWDRWPDGWPQLVRRVLKRSGSMWVFGTLRMFMERAKDFSGWKHAQDIIWEKQNGSNAASDRFKRVHDTIAQFYRDDARWGADIYKSPQYTYDAVARTIVRRARPEHWGAIGDGSYLSVDGGPRLMRSVLRSRSEHGRSLHPTQKPIAIVEPILLYSCPPGGHVLDPMAGSGTTGIVARRNGLSATLVEADPIYADIARNRLANDGFAFQIASSVADA